MAQCAYLRNNTECTVGQYHESKLPPILQFLGGLIGNALALFILIRSAKNHKWRPFYRLVLALTLTDSTISCLVYPVVLRRYASNFTYCLSDYECKHVAFIQSFAFLGSALLVTSMSVDRFSAIIFPTFYSTHSKSAKITIFIASSLILAAAVCVLPIAGIGQIKLYYPGSWCFIDFTSEETGNRIVTYIYSIFGLVIFTITAVMNTTVVLSLCRRMVQSEKKLGGNKHLKSDIYIVTFLLGIVIVFCVCWVPLMARMLHNANMACPQDGTTELLVVRLAITNSIVDPFVYIILRKENFDYIEHLLSRCKKRIWPSGDTGAIGQRPSQSSLPTLETSVATCNNKKTEVTASQEGMVSIIEM